MANKKSITKSKNGSDATRKRGFFIQRNYYYDTHDADGKQTSSMTHDEWKSQILAEWQDVGGLEYIAIAFHDKDLLDDGTPKPLHVHALVKYVEAKTASAVMKHFGISSTSNCQHVKSYVDTARYLIHVSESALNERKHIYLPSIVHMTDYGTKENPSRRLNFSDLMAANEDRKALAKDVTSMINEYCPALRGGEITLLSVQRDFVENCGEQEWKRNKPIFKNAADEYFASKLDYYTAQRNTRDLRTTYISGRGGTGKSQLGIELAWQYADVLGIHTVPVQGRSTTFDFVGTYQGERVSIANEFNTGLPFRQFCDVFDPLAVPTVSSRNVDKPWFSQYVILTNSDTLEPFITKLLYYSGHEFQDNAKTTIANGVEQLNTRDETINAAGQIRRRITFYLTLGEYQKKQWVDVYGLIYELREKPFEYSYLPLGRIMYGNIKNDKTAIAEAVKTLQDAHDPFDVRHNNYVPYDANGNATISRSSITITL